MTIESLRQEHSSKPRNKLIAQVFYLAGFIETWGRGIWKVDKAFTEESLPLPVYAVNSGGFEVTIPRFAPNNSFNPINVGINVGINEQKILDMIINGHNISASYVAEGLVISRRQAERLLASLKAKGLIRHIGANRNGHWELVNKQ